MFRSGRHRVYDLPTSQVMASGRDIHSAGVIRRRVQARERKHRSGL